MTRTEYRLYAVVARLDGHAKQIEERAAGVVGVDPLELRVASQNRGEGRCWWGGQFSGQRLFPGPPMPLP